MKTKAEKCPSCGAEVIIDSMTNKGICEYCGSVINETGINDNVVRKIDLAEVKAVINDVEYELTEDEETEFIQNLAINSQQIKIDFISDTDNACEIYDLMVNAGKTKLAYSFSAAVNMTNSKYFPISVKK